MRKLIINEGWGGTRDSGTQFIKSEGLGGVNDGGTTFVDTENDISDEGTRD